MRLPKLARRLLLAGALLLPVLVAGGWVWGWGAAMRQIETGFDAWVEARRAQGWSVTHAPTETGGAPLTARLTVPDLWISAPLWPSGPTVSWWVDRLDVALVLPRLRELSVTAPAGQRVRWGTEPEIPFMADRFEITLPLTPGVPPRGGVLRAASLRAGLPTGPLTVARLQIDLDTLPDAAEGETAATLRLDASDIMPPPGLPMPDPISQVEMEATLAGPIPVGRMTPAERIAAWREGGGTVSIGRLVLEWGELAVNGGATLTLDDASQPMGTAELRLSGVAEVIRALTQAGTLTPWQATAATVALMAMTRPAEDGGPPRVRLQATLQDRVLTIPPLPTVRVPLVTWPWTSAVHRP